MRRDENLARAIAYFERSDDKTLLQEMLRDLGPRAAAAVRRYQERGTKAPFPQEMVPAQNAATKEEALDIVEGELDFGELQAITRGVGRRLESLSQAELWNTMCNSCLV